MMLSLIIGRKGSLCLLLFIISVHRSKTTPSESSSSSSDFQGSLAFPIEEEKSAVADDIKQPENDQTTIEIENGDVDSPSEEDDSKSKGKDIPADDELLEKYRWPGSRVTHPLLLFSLHTVIVFIYYNFFVAFRGIETICFLL